MRVGTIITKDNAGNQYVLTADGQAAPLDITEIGALKNAMDKYVVTGLKAKVGSKSVPMVAGLMLTNNGLVKRKKFPAG